MKIKDVMTCKVVTVKPDTSIHEVARLLFDQGLTGMPVVNGDNNVVGIITEYDLMSRGKHIHIPTFLDMVQEFDIKDSKKNKQKIKEICNLKVRELMTVPVVSITPNAEIKEVARIFTEKHINPLPVIDANRQLVGIISRADIVKIFRDN